MAIALSILQIEWAWVLTRVNMIILSILMPDESFVHLIAFHQRNLICPVKMALQ